MNETNKPWLTRQLDKIPALMSSKVSIFIFIFLFVYLFIFGVVGIWFPKIAPSAQMQLILGNYTNVLSALGASIAAGAGASIHHHIKKINQRHEELSNKIDALTEQVKKQNK